MQWRARDALVLKWVSLQLNGKLPLSPPSVRTQLDAGGDGAGCRISPAHLRAGYRFMYRTDIRVITGISVRLS